MSFLTVNWFSPANRAAAAVAALGWIASSLTAGEPIQFSTKKNTPPPGVENKLTKEKFSPLDRLPSVSPHDVMNSSGAYSGNSMRRRDPKEEKRLKNAKLEKENWMVLDKGELQEQDDQETDFGIRDYNADTLEKEEKGAGEIWFGPKQDRAAKSPGKSRAPNSVFRGPGQSRPQLVPSADDKESSLSFGKPVGKETGPLVGDHSKELNLQNVLTDPANQPLKDLFGSGPVGAHSSDDRSRRDFGLRSFDAQTGAGPLGRSFGLGSELNRPNSSVAPLMGQPSALSDSRPGPDRLSSSASSKFDVNTPLGNPPPPLARPRNDYAPVSTRDIFAPPPRPGSFGNR